VLEGGRKVSGPAVGVRLSEFVAVRKGHLGRAHWIAGCNSSDLASISMDSLVRMRCFGPER